VLGLSSVLCSQFCQFLWIVHSWLSLRFSLTFTRHEPSHKDNAYKTWALPQRIRGKDEPNMGYICLSFTRNWCLFHINLHYIIQRLVVHQKIRCILRYVFALCFFVLCDMCCQFLWTALFWFPLRYSLAFIYMTQAPIDSGQWAVSEIVGFYDNKYQLLVKELYR
jgi:hypothetical protein